MRTDDGSSAYNDIQTYSLSLSIYLILNSAISSDTAQYTCLMCCMCRKLRLLSLSEFGFFFCILLYTHGVGHMNKDALLSLSLTNYIFIYMFYGYFGITNTTCCRILDTLCAANCVRERMWIQCVFSRLWFLLRQMRAQKFTSKICIENVVIDEFLCLFSCFWNKQKKPKMLYAYDDDGSATTAARAVVVAASGVAVCYW